MSAAAGILLRLVLWIGAAPLLPGVINKVKAWVAGRRGPPVLQLYSDLARLWRKSVVVSSLASPAFIAGPAVAWVAVLGAALLLPAGPAGGVAGFQGDVVLFVYLLALARLCTAWSAMEPGSAFGALGASREVSFAVLAEAALMTALLALAVQGGTAALGGMLSPAPSAVPVLVAGGLFAVLLAENSRVPFDDPGTHLELTMVHEAMVLEHSGPPLAFALHGAAMKLLLFAVLLSEAVLPVGRLSAAAGAAGLAAAVAAVTVGVGVVESLLARFAFRRVPLLLTTAFLMCLFALLLAGRGAAP